MRRQATWMLAIAAALAGACSVFGDAESAAPPAPVPQADAAAAPPPSGDAGSIDDAGLDADAAKTTPPCTTTANETLSLAVDANLNPAAGHQDLSGVAVCNLAALDCLLQFTRKASAGKPIVSLSLVIPRATSNDCGDSCALATYHGTGTIAVQHMRTDWDSTANWTERHSTGGGWSADGATASGDATDVIATVPVPAAASATIPIDGAKLGATFMADANLAFRVAGQPAFEFVIQRTIGAAPNRATLVVTYCTK